MPLLDIRSKKDLVGALIIFSCETDFCLHFPFSKEKIKNPRKSAGSIPNHCRHLLYCVRK